MASSQVLVWLVFPTKGAPDADLRVTPPKGAGGTSLDRAREAPELIAQLKSSARELEEEAAKAEE